MPAGLTPRQHDALRFIERYIAEHDGVAPSYREIANGVGLKSKSSVTRLLKGLGDRGHIVMGRRSQERTLSLPTVFGPNCPHCGMPLRSQKCETIADLERRWRKEDREARQ